MNKNCVVIFSGGLDSTVLLYSIKNQGYKIYGLSFDYSQRHVKELEFARNLGIKLCIEHKVIPLNFMRDIASNSALSGDKPLPINKDPEHKDQVATIVPNRNMLMLSVAIAWAENLKINKVFYGAHKGDKIIYPDCRENFVKALSKASQLGTYSKVKIEAPFVSMRKAGLIKLGVKLEVNFKETRTCYTGEDMACGICGSCLERIAGFKQNKIIDPIPYNINIDWKGCKKLPI